MENELIEITKINPKEVFTKTGCRPIIEMIRDKVKDFVGDVSTVKGRKEIASLAAKIAKSKVLLDDMGKDLVSDWKEQAKIVDEVRRIIRDELDNLKEDVRKPLTDFEEAEEKRISDIKAKILFLHETLKDRHKTPESADEKIKLIEEMVVNENFQEFYSIAAGAKEAALKFLTEEKELIIKRFEEQKELDRLRKEKADADRIERERKIAEEAAEKARNEEVRKAKEEIERVERLKKEAEERAKKADKEKKEAEERAEFLKNKAIEEEREKERKKKADEEAELARRKADQDHRRRINNEAKDDLISLGFSQSVAERMVASVATGRVRNIRINY